MAVEILIGDALERLRELSDGSVHCCVTSPPYWCLRDYGVDGQIGLEETPDEWCRKLVDVFREVRRVLRDDGTLWVNVGDSYAAGTCGRNDEDEANFRRRFEAFGTGRPKAGRKGANGQSHKAPSGYKPKDLIGAPWMLAFALRADGWWLRRDIIWHKPNTMPESVTDRPTSAHEYVFLLSKSARYWYDCEVLKDPSVYPEDNRKARASAEDYQSRSVVGSIRAINPKNDKAYPTRNARSVWSIATKPFPEAHFATFPPELARRCILAGCPVDGTVLDPFGGAGTTGLVADRLQRNATLIELNPDYAAMARRRIDADRGGLLDLMEGAA